MEYLSHIHSDFTEALDMLINRDKFYNTFSLNDIRQVIKEELKNNGGCVCGKQHCERKRLREEDSRTPD